MVLLKKQEAICLELGDQDGLQASYGNQALILQDWGRLEEAMALHKKQEAICLELGDQDGLQDELRESGVDPQGLGASGRGNGVCLRSRKPSAWSWATSICLQTSYGNQALILKAWGRLEEAMALLKKQEAICLELGDQEGLQGELR